MNTPEKFQKYRQLGLKLTPQRLAILEFLEGNTTHPSADEIYQHVAQRFPSMSFATVYNTLDALRRKGQILELCIDPNKKRFDPNPVPHHHIFCTRCHKIVDVDHDYKIELNSEESKGFKVMGCNIVFWGLCPECQKEELSQEKTNDN